MALSSLFYGMEAYLDGDVEINNNVTTPEEDAVAAADQSAEIANDVADANVEAKDSEVQAQMLIQMSKLYTHVKTYGIDRTFVSLYNQNGELDRMCGIRFPSCESMPATGNPYSQYSSRFIAAMEDGNKGIWASIKKFFATIWHWLKTTAQTVWQKIKYKFMKHRLEYVDALRGLAILLVVFMHVPQYGFGQSIGGNYMEMAILLAVPLFFFISGLFVPLEITPPFQ